MRHAEALESGPETTHTVSERVIQAIADREGVSPLDISPPLFDAIDPDALDRLYGNGRSGTSVAFEYSGYRVSVRPDGRVELTPLSN